MSDGVHFGEWCAYDPNIFCQERMGCEFCNKRRAGPNAPPGCPGQRLYRSK